MAGVLLVAACGGMEALDLTVTNTSDDGPGSLRDAMEQVSELATDQSSTIRIGVTGTVSLSSPLPLISSSLTIEGPPPATTPPGETFRIEGGGAGPIFRFVVSPISGGVRISDICIVDGQTVIQGVVAGSRPIVSFARILFASNTRTTSGGAIRVSGNSFLRIERCVLTGCSSEADGGALSVGADAMAIVNGCEFSECSAAGSGGAIAVEAGGSCAVMGSVISGCTATRNYGGAIHNLGTVTVADSTIDACSARWGGGVHNGGEATLKRSTFSNNVGSWRGGGIHNAGDCMVLGSTVSGNTGGGIANTGFNKTLSCFHCTITRNNGGCCEVGGFLTWDKVIMGNTIVAANTGGTIAGPPDILIETGSGGMLTSLGGNIVGCVDPGFFNGSGDKTGTPENELDALLGPLQDNGGPTLSHLPLPGSPAIDGGNTDVTFDHAGMLRADGALVGFDQRGWMLPIFNSTFFGPDVGSVETSGIDTASAGEDPEARWILERDIDCDFRLDQRESGLDAVDFARGDRDGDGYFNDEEVRGMLDDPGSDVAIEITEIGFDEVQFCFIVSWNSEQAGPASVYMGDKNDLRSLAMSLGSVLPVAAGTIDASPAVIKVPSELENRDAVFMQIARPNP